MSQNQKDQLDLLISDLVIEEFHHGDCKGADREAAIIVRANEDHIRIVPHPAKKGFELQRDKEIVAAVDILIAAPRTDKEVLRSGTWATVRYARAKGIPIVMLPRKS
jgi:hypothetical protein